MSHAQFDKEISKIDGLTIITSTKKETNCDVKTFEMTGSPKDFGFATKEEFVKAIEKVEKMI